jgi:hypothetical protein
VCASAYLDRWLAPRIAKEETIRPSSRNKLLRISFLNYMLLRRDNGLKFRGQNSASLYLSCTNWMLRELPYVHPLWLRVKCVLNY